MFTDELEVRFRVKLEEDAFSGGQIILIGTIKGEIVLLLKVSVRFGRVCVQFCYDRATFHCKTDSILFVILRMSTIVCSYVLKNEKRRWTDGIKSIKNV